MPYKCVVCDKVVQIKAEQQCECADPKFLKCEIVHYTDQEGKGRPHSKQMRSIGFPNQKVKQEEITLNLACHTEELLPHACNTESLVTCPDCLSFLSEMADGMEDS